MHIAWRGRQKLDGCERSISLAAGRTRGGRLARRLDRAYLVQVAQAEPEQFRADKTNGKVLIGRQPMYLEVEKTKHQNKPEFLSTPRPRRRPGPPGVTPASDSHPRRLHAREEGPSLTVPAEPGASNWQLNAQPLKNRQPPGVSYVVRTVGRDAMRCDAMRCDAMCACTTKAQHKPIAAVSVVVCCATPEYAETAI